MSDFAHYYAPTRVNIQCIPGWNRIDSESFQDDETWKTRQKSFWNSMFDRYFDFEYW